MTDALLNYETVKFFCAEEGETSRFAAAIARYQSVEYRLMASLAGLNVIQSTIIFAGTAAGLVLCAKGVAEGALRVGDAVLYVALVGQLAVPLNWFGTFYRTIQQQMLDVDGMFQLLANVPTVADAPDATPLALTSGTVEFRDVWYAWGPTLPPVLRGVSVRVPGGTSCAVVGPTGSGKSTLLRLAFRFADPDRGCVLFDGVDARRVTQRSLRALVAVVPQDAVLFNASVRDNIAFGVRAGRGGGGGEWRRARCPRRRCPPSLPQRPGATPADVEAAAAAASIHDAVLAMPAGYDTVVGERGLRLSGGEKQRVALARAILKRAPILLLDEATSALDATTEAAVQAALQGGGGDGRARTTIIVAHRLSTVADCDQTVVIRSGEVVETGTHAALVAAGGLYCELWSRQASGGGGGGDRDEGREQAAAAE